MNEKETAMTSWNRLALVLALALGSAPAWAAPCAGFTDVEDTTAFCPSVEWLKNRFITTGCTLTEYCPSAPVSRLAMAAFMQRLGRSLSPEVHVRHDGTGVKTIPGESPDPLLRLCEMQADLIPMPYPRRTILGGTMSGLADGDAVAYRVFWVYSTDSGATWSAIMDTGQSINSPRASSPANQWSGAALSFALDLPANTPLRVAMGVRRDNILLGTTGNFANTRCQMAVTILNANGETSPY